MAPPCFRYQGKTRFPLCPTRCPSNSALRSRVAHELALRAREKTRPPRTGPRRSRETALGIGPSPAVPGRLEDRGACQLPRRARAARVGDRAAASGAGDWGPLCCAQPGAWRFRAWWGGGFQGRDENRSERDWREVPRFSSILTRASVGGCWGGDAMGRLPLVPPPTPGLRLAETREGEHSAGPGAARPSCPHTPRQAASPPQRLRPRASPDPTQPRAPAPGRSGTPP